MTLVDATGKHASFGALLVVTAASLLWSCSASDRGVIGAGPSTDTGGADVTDASPDGGGGASDASDTATSPDATDDRDAGPDGGAADGGADAGPGDTAGDTVDGGGEVCGGLAGKTCGSDQWCDYANDSCGIADQQGVCRSRPTPDSCPETKNPVCGCDGTTYDTPCDAHAHGVDVHHTGQCKSSSKTCGGPNDETCPSKKFCDYPNDSCGTNDATGTCKKTPSACTEQYQPVCGCDGKTYGNPCKAHSHGVDIAHSGECTKGPCGGDTCGSNDFCRLPKGQCGASEKKKGTCKVKPSTCPKIRQPVCGCDGNTYGNECLAFTKGVSIKHDGQCKSNTGPCGGKTCSSKAFCQLPKGQCGASKKKKGTCQPTPGACPTVFKPVCGCDGKTYSNECKAAAAGVSVAHDGKCQSATGPCGGQTCSSGEYCYLPKGSCGASKKKKGSCKAKPQGCPAVFKPVCGCDGKTYSNECSAAAAGLNVAHDGKCTSSGACGGKSCSSGEYCMLPKGQCGASKKKHGSCTTKPGSCPRIFQPVCGCDGKTYPNDCVAKSKGVSIKHDGKCQQQTGCGPGGITCRPTSYCDFPNNDCGKSGPNGTCKQRPQACPRVVKPVCGCNGRTYNNECEAHAAGVDIKHTGKCRKQRSCGGQQCTSKEFCRVPVGACGQTSSKGMCTKKPGLCPAVYNPVCGCDGTTYSNSCKAYSAGVNIAHKGSC